MDRPLDIDKRLDSLDPGFKPIVYEFLARLTESGLVVLLIETRRSQIRQDVLLKKNSTWTEHSKHLVGKAIDICPYHQYLLHGSDKLEWDPNDPVWQRIGEIGGSLGLQWGIMKDGKHMDLGHFQEE